MCKILNPLIYANLHELVLKFAVISENSWRNESPREKFMTFAGGLPRSLRSTLRAPPSLRDAHLHCTKRTICYELLSNSKIRCKCCKGRRLEQSRVSSNLFTSFIK